MMSHFRRLSVVAFAAFGSLLLACSSSPEKTPPATVEGNHEVMSCNEIVGWVWDRNRPDVPLSVIILDGSTPLATVTADVLRGDLVTAGKGNGRHGFSYVVPASLKNDQPHEIRIMESVTGIRLSNTPQQLTCPS